MTALVAAAAAYSFSPRATPPLAPSRLAVDSMHFNVLTTSAAGLVAAGELGHLLVSKDQGQTWESAKTSHNRLALINQVAFDPEGKVGVAVGHEGWILKTDDGGLNWQEVAFSEERGEPLMSVARLPSGDWVAVGAFGRALRLDAALSQVTPIDLPESVRDHHLNRIVGSADGQRWQVVGERGLVMLTDAQWQDWQVIEPFYNGSFYGGGQLADGSWLIYGMRGNVYVSPDGAHWTRSQLPAPASFFDHAQLADGRVILVGQGGLTLYSADSGRTFAFNRLKTRSTLTDVQLLPDGKALVASDKGLLTLDVAPAAQPTAPTGVSQ